MPQPFYPRLTLASEQTLRAMWSLGESEQEIMRVLRLGTLGAVRHHASVYFLPARVTLKPKPRWKADPKLEVFEEAMELPLDPWPIKVRFENITKEEARAVSLSAPMSGRNFAQQQRYSLTGSAAAMCAGA